MATKDFFDELNVGDEVIRGLEDCVAYEKGDSSRARKTILRVSSPHYRPEEIARLRKSLSMTQRGMAMIIGVSPRTVEGWEIGRTIPNGTAQRLLYLMDNDPTVVERLILEEMQ